MDSINDGNGQYVDLDKVMWEQLHAAILKSPRFKEMYEAGGMFNDGLQNTLDWLNGMEDDMGSTGGGAVVIENTMRTTIQERTKAAEIKKLMARICELATSLKQEGWDVHAYLSANGAETYTWTVQVTKEMAL